MRCPKCRTPTRVTETRDPYRTRTCPECGATFNTIERAVLHQHGTARTLAAQLAKKEQTPCTR
jgi:transcriptional regulator NrdR family protein